MLTLTPSRGPGEHRLRAGPWTCAYRKNNNKNLLALQTAQPALGDRLAWHFQTSWTCPKSSQTWAPLHTCRCSLQHSMHPGAPPRHPFQNTRANPANPTILQTEICFVSLFLKEGLLSSLKLCMTR